MSTTTKKVSLFESEEGTAIAKALRLMESDTSLTTVSSYTTNITLYHDNVMPFVQKHMTYLDTHPKVDVEKYLANLRLMIKIRN